MRRDPIYDGVYCIHTRECEDGVFEITFDVGFRRAKP